jgi:hypothetical protein
LAPKEVAEVEPIQLVTLKAVALKAMPQELLLRF